MGKPGRHGEGTGICLPACAAPSCLDGLECRVAHGRDLRGHRREAGCLCTGTGHTAKQPHGGEQLGQRCGQAASPPTEVPPAPSQQQAGSPGVPGAPVIGSLQMAGCLGIYYPSMPFRGGLAA